MFESDRRPDTPIEWDQTMDHHPGPYQPGWRHTWFRRHRPQPIGHMQQTGRPCTDTPLS